MTHHDSFVHKSFVLGLVAKGCNACIEIFSGIGLLVIAPDSILHAIVTITAEELQEDPHDKLAHVLLTYAQQFSVNSQVFAAVYLLVHGLVKIGLVVALIKRYLWAYPLAIIVFCGFIVYQLYRFFHTFSLVLLVLTLFDIGIIVVTWAEYKRVKRASRLL